MKSNTNWSIEEGTFNSHNLTNYLTTGWSEYHLVTRVQGVRVVASFKFFIYFVGVAGSSLFTCVLQRLT